MESHYSKPILKIKDLFKMKYLVSENLGRNVKDIPIQRNTLQISVIFKDVVTLSM